MEQVSLYLSGELDYVKLKGSTGPLVYPAGHVYIYSVLYKLTEQGRDIFTAQVVFTGVYLMTLGIVLAVYLKAKVSFSITSGPRVPEKKTYDWLVGNSKSNAHDTGRDSELSFFSSFT